jgi:hypothetical protein
MTARTLSNDDAAIAAVEADASHSEPTTAQSRKEGTMTEKDSLDYDDVIAKLDAEEAIMKSAGSAAEATTAITEMPYCAFPGCARGGRRRRIALGIDQAGAEVGGAQGGRDRLARGRDAGSRSGGGQPPAHRDIAGNGRSGPPSLLQPAQPLPASAQDRGDADPPGQADQRTHRRVGCAQEAAGRAPTQGAVLPQSHYDAPGACGGIRKHPA